MRLLIEIYVYSLYLIPNSLHKTNRPVFEIAEDIITNSSVRASLIVSNYETVKLTETISGKFPVNLLKNEIFGESPRGLRFPRHHKLFDPFNDKIKQLLEGGIMQMWVEEFYNLKRTITSKHPEVLTTDHLSTGFKIWLSCVFIATSSFVLELIIFNRRRICQYGKDLLVLVIDKLILLLHNIRSLLRNV